MEIALILLACILFPTAAIAVIVIAVVVVLLATCWPAIPIILMLGSMLGMISKTLKS
jgi:hypothetical protein